MRKSNRRITDLAIINELLQSAPVGRLGTVGADGWPMVKPLNFACHQGRVYFHCALEGEKLDHIRHDDRVCFEVDLPIAYVTGSEEDPCRATYLFRSVIIRGRAQLVGARAEKVAALDLLMAKYQPRWGGVRTRKRRWPPPPSSGSTSRRWSARRACGRGRRGRRRWPPWRAAPSCR